jgi:hypothetical protein
MKRNCLGLRERLLRDPRARWHWVTLPLSIRQAFVHGSSKAYNTSIGSLLSK